MLQFDAEHVLVRKVRTHVHGSPRPSGTVLTQHAFFAEVCDALDGIALVLVTGRYATVAEFRRYADTHRPPIASHIVAYEVVDPPNGRELISLARKYFVEHAAEVHAGLPG